MIIVNEFLNVGRYISKQENISIILWKFYNKLYMNQYYFVSCLNILNFCQFKRPPPPSKIMLATLQAHNLLPQLPWQLWTYFSIVMRSQTFCVVGVLRAHNFLNLLPWLSVQIFVVFFLLTPNSLVWQTCLWYFKSASHDKNYS